MKKSINKTTKKPVEKKNTTKTAPKTVANEIWEDIKNIKLPMFSLPNQFVSTFCNPVIVEPSKCYLTTTASAVLPLLETALSEKYTVEKMDKYIVVSYIVNK